MMYNYIKLADDTQIAHSNILEDQNGAGLYRAPC